MGQQEEHAQPKALPTDDGSGHRLRRFVAALSAMPLKLASEPVVGQFPAVLALRKLAASMLALSATWHVDLFTRPS